MEEEFVAVVNEDDQALYTVTRTEAHEKVLKHRVVNAWFFNNNGEVLLQKRPRPEPSKPGFLDYTVGGHVSDKETYEQALLKETQEETGIQAVMSGFNLIGTYMPSADVVTPDVAMHVRKIYARPFLGEISDLSFDPNELEGFEWRNISDLLAEIKSTPKKFVPIFAEEYELSAQTLRHIQALSHDLGEA